MAKDGTREARYRRHSRVRKKVSGTGDKPRLCVFRSLTNVYAQIIDDNKKHTLAAASTLDAELKEDMKNKKKTEQSALVGSLLAKRAKDAKIEQIVFDRGGYRYHGRVKALAEAARKGGLKF